MKSVLDPKFKYTPSFDTDVGRHLRAHKRKLEDQRKQQQANEAEVAAKVEALPKRKAAK